MGHQSSSSSSNVIVPFEFSSEMDPLPGVDRPLSNVSNFMILSGRPVCTSRAGITHTHPDITIPSP